MSVTRKQLGDLVQVQLKPIPNVGFYRGEIPATPPLLADTDRVGPYVVLWTGTGAEDPQERSLDDVPMDDIDYRFTVSCVAGLEQLVDPLVDLVLERLHGWWPEVPGASTDVCRLEADAGPSRPGTGFTPPRYYRQLPFRFHAGS